MDDSPVQETDNISNKNNLEDIDPLDAYMLEIDEQVQKLDEKDKLKEAEELAASRLKAKTDKEKESIEANDLEEDENEEEEEETIGKAGNFSTVEELIA